MRPFKISSRASMVAASISSGKYIYIRKSNGNYENGNDTRTYRIIRELLTELGNLGMIFHIGPTNAISAREWIVGLLKRLPIAERVERGIERLGFNRTSDEFGPVPRE
jgi:hypothetical protein